MTEQAIILNVVVGQVPLHPIYLGVVVDPLNPGDTLTFDYLLDFNFQ